MVEGQTNANGTMDAYEASESAQSILDRANETAARIEAANRKAEELLRQSEALAARERLEGRSLAEKQAQKIEETPREYAQRILHGEV